MIRFFAKPQNVGERTIKMSAEDTEHIRSLRLRPSELFIVCDGEGTDYVCRLSDGQADEKVKSSESTALIMEKRHSKGEPTVECTVYIAFMKGERLDYAVQKSVELGAHGIALFISDRCILKPSNASSRIERYQRIATETAKQSGRGIIPEVSFISSLKKVLDAAVPSSDLTTLCYEDEKNLHIQTVLEHYFPLIALIEKPMTRTVSIITGPEGGFEPSEVELAQSRDVSVVSLGNRILRSETAPIVALSAIMYHTGNL